MIKVEKVESYLDTLQEEDEPNQTEINRLTNLLKNLKLDRSRYEKELVSANKIQTKQGEENLTSLQKDADEQKKAYESKAKERNKTETRVNRTKPLDELKEKDEILERRIEEDKRIKDDPNASQS